MRCRRWDPMTWRTSTSCSLLPAETRREAGRSSSGGMEPTAPEARRPKVVDVSSGVLLPCAREAQEGTRSNPARRASHARETRDPGYENQRGGEKEFLEPLAQEAGWRWCGVGKLTLDRVERSMGACGDCRSSLGCLGCNRETLLGRRSPQELVSGARRGRERRRSPRRAQRTEVSNRG